MKHLFTFLFCLLSIIGVSQNKHVAGEVIVKLENADIEQYLEKVNQQFPELSADFIETLSSSLNIYLFSFNSNTIHEFSPLLKFSEFPVCRYAQWNHTDIKYRKTPDDPTFVTQWSLKNIEAEKAWDITTGGYTKDNQQIVIAVIDESFYLNHDDMIGRFWKNNSEIPNNGIDEDNNGYVDDFNGWNVLNDTNYIYSSLNGHGTKVSGILGASTNNSQDIASINWNTKVLPVQMGNVAIESLVIKAYDYVLKQRLLYNRTYGDSGAYIVAANSSFGVDNGNRADYPIWCEMYNTMGQVGIISVGAGPNDEVNIDIAGDVPCNCSSDYLIAVTSTDINDNLRGGGYGYVNMDLGAPGVGVLSLSATNSVTTGTGTSYATPMVTAAIGLMYSAIPYDSMKYHQNKPAELAQKVRTLLLDNTKSTPTLTNKSTTGGMLNLYQAVSAASKFEDVSIGIENINNDSRVLIYPNPVNDLLQIELKESSSIINKFSLYSTSGQCVLKEGNINSETATLNLQNLNSGIYFLHLTLKGEGNRIVKVVKQ